MNVREAQIAKFRDQAALEELVAGTLDEFCFQAACDGEDGVQPIEQKRVLIKVAAATMLEAVLEDGHDPRGVTDARGTANFVPRRRKDRNNKLP